jgi:Xaa-Pro dipeptidase
LPDAAVVYDAVKDELTLFIPPINPESVIWSGLPLSPEEAAKLYDVDRVLFTTDVNSTLA